MIEVVTVTDVIDECHDTKTIRFDCGFTAIPGQFVMVWIPGTDEIPMSLSDVGGNKSITVKAIGEATRSLHKLKKDDKLRIRGPYGNGFALGGRMLIVGGGVGTAAIMPVVRMTGADTIIAARSSADIIMEDEAKKFAQVRIATDDGSRGFHGNAVQLMNNLLSEKEYDCVMGCGPEIMLWHMYRACRERGVECQLSLERYMKCGAGACGCCAIDSARVCRDGPVFSSEQLETLTEFNMGGRDECGRFVRF